jgi:biotin operon repressor
MRIGEGRDRSLSRHSLVFKAGEWESVTSNKESRVGYSVIDNMSLAEIIEQLPKLTAEERQAIYRQTEDLDGEPLFEATEQMRAAIEEATRSLKAGEGIPVEDLRQRFLAKWATK